ncbi:MAG: cobalamin-dependent protein [Bacillota bacterium]|nr:cobalamin-dependent protein [Bacillota bacterium]
MNDGSKVLLITPPYHAGVLESAGRWPHLGFVYLAGHLRQAGFVPVIYDAMTKGDDLVAIGERIRMERPGVVCSTAYTSSIYAALDVLRTAKALDPAIVTVLGGVHAHFMYEEILRQSPEVDFVVRGEGELTLPELLRCLAADGSEEQLRGVKGLAFRGRDGLVVTPPRPLVEDLDALLPAWDLVEWEDYTFYPLAGSRLAILDTSRGCSHDCSFCSQQKFWERCFRGRRPERVVEELLHLNREYGVDVVMFSDEYPTKERERWERLLDLIIASGVKLTLLMETRVEDILRDRDILTKYRQAGVLHIYVGVEATNQETLDRFKKELSCRQSLEAIELINRHGMVSECSFVLGLPEDTPASIAHTLELARYYDPDFPHFLHLAPWPYADLYQELEPYIITRDYSKYNFVEPVVKPAAMSEAEIRQAVLDCYRKFYLEKVGRIREEADPFKRKYLLRSVQVMVENSFLARHMGGGQGEIPETVRRLLREISLPAAE